ncbi:MAG: plasmid partition protein ParG [Nostoc sp. DedQUE12a]|nr:plasmid partition protein ParG [Nostoc sp. DedQUE12a]
MVRITHISTKSKKMHISITDDLKKRFHATWVMRGKNMSQVVIELIEQWLESNEVPQRGEIKRL